MDEETKLLTTRENLFQQIGRLRTFFINFEAVTDLVQITHRRAKLEEIYPNLLTVQDKIESIGDYKDSIKRKRIDKEYYSCHDMSILAEKEFLKNQIPSLVEEKASESEIKKEASTTATSAMKITEILPNFNGDYKCWRYFYQTFKPLVHENPELSQICKFHYLRSCLEDEPSSLVEYSSPENYSDAWDKLVERYEKPRLIVDAHLKELLELPGVKNGSPGEIRALSVHLAKHANALKGMNHSIDCYLLVYLVVSKLDAVTRNEWERASSDTETPTLGDLMEFLDKFSRGN